MIGGDLHGIVNSIANNWRITILSVCYNASSFCVFCGLWICIDFLEGNENALFGIVYGSAGRNSRIFYIAACVGSNTVVIPFV